MKRLIPVALALFVWAPANGQVQINRWQDLKPYIAQQTDAINDHGEKLRYQQALIDKLIATVDQQRLWILDFACKWNGLNEQLSKAQSNPPVGAPQIKACDGVSPAPLWPDFIAYAPPAPTTPTDNFNRADGPAGANWSAGTISGNRLRVTGTAVWVPNIGADQSVEAKVWATGSTWNYVGLVLRATAGTSSTQYRVTISTTEKTWSLEYIDGTGAFTRLAGGAIVYQPGAVMRAQVKGGAITVWYAGQQLAAVTDTRIANGKPGLIGLTDAATFAEFDDVLIGAVQ